MATTNSTLPGGGADTPADVKIPVASPAPDTAIAIPVQYDGPRGRWIIYVYRDRLTGKFYVGVTWRTLEERTSSHINSARRKRRVRPGGLLARLRELNVTGKTFHQHFDVSVVATASTQHDVRRLEAAWMTHLEARAPHGLNLMPGGSSLGGPANSKPTTVRLQRRQRHFRSIGEALDASNRATRRRRGRVIRRSTAHARLTNGWRLEEALGFEPHRDGRGVRSSFLVNGVAYDALRDTSAATGIPIDTLRSRLHRASNPGSGMRDPTEPVEIGDDRRTFGAGRQPMLGLRHPHTGEPVSARTYSRLTGIPVSTVLHRVHRLGAGSDPHALAMRVERRRLVSLPAPDGTLFRGGFREVVRRVHSPDWRQLEGARSLSASGIRARLRRLSREELSTPVFVRWACGQIPGDPSYSAIVAQHQRHVGD